MESISFQRVYYGWEAIGGHVYLYTKNTTLVLMAGFTAVCHISSMLHTLLSFRFLHGHLKEDIHMKLPGVYEKAGHCAKLNRSIYGSQKHGTNV